MSSAKIFCPTKTPMQSGKAKTGYWVLEIPNPLEKSFDPALGWTSSTSTVHQIHLQFPTLEAALTYASKEGLKVDIIDPSPVSPIEPKAYGDNFRHYKPK